MDSAKFTFVLIKYNEFYGNELKTSTSDTSIVKPKNKIDEKSLFR